ncbi:hypothetical protein GOBAR_AA00522 [Gossypium barbadense]|uniref:Uncharacterized protein n=1 Tax=Gossypium barbadense TaxID=3634 RepID=A0A2P5YWS5_GOSBA|nr:hypothetical protein GOBAR_AA00522 [Gossypium barbadense]
MVVSLQARKKWRKNEQDYKKSNLPIVFDASGIDANKLVVPEASLVCLSFRANSQVSFIDSWVLFLNPIKQLLLRFMRKSSDGAKDTLQRHIVYSFGDHYYFRKELKILNLLTGLRRCFFTCLKFCVRLKLYAYQYPIDIPCGYFWLAWSSLVLVLKPCWLKRMNKFTVLRYLNFVAENLGVEFFKVGINGIYLFDIEPVGKAVEGVLAFGGQSN